MTQDAPRHDDVRDAVTTGRGSWRQERRATGARRAPRPVRRGAPRTLLVISGAFLLVAALPVTVVPAFLGFGGEGLRVVAGYGFLDFAAVWCALVVWIIAMNIAKMRNRRRDPGVAVWGEANGWRHHTEPDRAIVRLQNGPPFSSPEHPFATEVLSSQRDGNLAMSWTQRWVVQHDGDSTEWRAHVVAVTLPVALPRIEVTPERLVDRAVKAMGGQDVSVELEAFNRAYRVVTSDARVAHAVLHPRLVERLVQPDALGVRWRIEGRWIAAWTSGHTDVSRIEPWTRLLLDVARSLPPHLVVERQPDGSDAKPPAGTIGAPSDP